MVISEYTIDSKFNRGGSVTPTIIFIVLSDETQDAVLSQNGVSLPQSMPSSNNDYGAKKISDGPNSYKT
jgi:hypothetical protein